MTSELHLAVDVLASAIRRQTAPLMVAIDGPSGAGKSTLAAIVAARLGTALISTDDFFDASITATGWATRSPEQRAADALDWRRLRHDALEPLRAGQVARWQSFDFVAGPRPDGTYAMNAVATVCSPNPVVILEGAYSSRPELADLVDFAVLVDAPFSVRAARLALRENPAVLAAWHARWDAAEAYYFGQIRPPAAFDLVLDLAAEDRVPIAG